MDSMTRRQRRVQNCIHTILEVHEFMGGRMISSDIVEQMETLKGMLREFQPTGLTERDLSIIEASTSQLLGELKKVFQAKGLGFIHAGYRH